MNRSLLVLLLFVLAGVTLPAQEPSRPDHAERARPRLEKEYKREIDPYPYIQRAPGPTISSEFGLFLNTNLIVQESSLHPVPQNESSIAINPVAPNFLISSAVDFRGNYAYISSNGGRTWKNVHLGNVNDNWRTGNDPSVAYDYEGNGYVMYGAFPASGIASGQSGVYLAKTSDNGETWQRHIIVIEHKGTMTPDSAFEDKYYIEIDNSSTSPYRGYVYTPWKRVIDRDSSTQIVVARSTDRGLTWHVPVPVSPRKPGTSLDTTFGQSFPITTTGPDGALYVAWNDGPIRSIGFVKSTDGGVTFTSPTYPVQGYPTLGTARAVDGSVYHVLKGTFRAETYPTMMADNSNSPRRGWLYLVYAAGLTPDIHFTRSTDGGVTWSQPKVIQSETRGDQWWPWLAVDQTNGDIAVMYSDSRNDPANILVDTYVGYSSDGGETWIDRRTTDYMSDFRKNGSVDSIFAGDYSGIAFHAGKVYPSFFDTREDYDVYTAVVDLRQPYPVENFVARGKFTTPQEVTLTWRNPEMETVFGLPISGYTLVLSRNGVYRTTLPAGTTFYKDEGLIYDSNYVYTIHVAVGEDTSVARTVTFRPRDMQLPAAPIVERVADHKPQVDLLIRMPGVRADSATPLENLKAYRIYNEAGSLIQEQALTPGDTGRVITATLSPGARGYYKYRVSVIDASAPENESALTDTIIVYAGDLTPYQESFDGVKPKFLVTGGWNETNTLALSAPNSITDSPDGLYLGRRNDYFQIYPVAMTRPIDLRFAHIAIVDAGDSAALEISYDSGATWSILRTYNFRSSDSWLDKKADPGDWQQETVTLQHPNQGPSAIGVVRFRLWTNSLVHLDGWYIDDISFGQPAGVEAESGGEDVFTSRAYPNPASGAAIIEYRLSSAADVRVRILDVMGREIRTLVDARREAGPHAVTLDGASLPNGVYFYEIAAGGRTGRGRIILSH